MEYLRWLNITLHKLENNDAAPINLDKLLYVTKKMRFYLIILAVFIYGCSPVFRYHLPTNPNGIDGITNEIKSVLVPSGYDFIPEGSNNIIR